MAFTSWPFDFETDGVTPQETTEDEFRHTLAASSQNGVGGEDHLEVSALADSSAVSLTSGYGSVAGYSCYNDADAQVSAPSNSASNPRLYWVVLRLDRSARQITPAIVEGSAASSPQLPTLQRDPDTTFEEPLASFRRAGSGGGITDLVDYRAVINPQGSRAVSSDARPPYPADGERIYETDTGREMYYHSGSWQASADPSYPTAWQTLTLSSGYTSPGHGATPSWRWDAPDIVRLRGRIGRTSGGVLANGSTLATLPSAARPPDIHAWAVASTSRRGSDVDTRGNTSRLELLTGGTLLVYTEYNPLWVGLDGVTYAV